MVFWVISVYFNVRNIPPKSGTFPSGTPVYVVRRQSVNYIKGQRLSWFGHVQRIANDRTVKKMSGKRYYRIGRKTKRWMEKRYRRFKKYENKVQ